MEKKLATRKKAHRKYKHYVAALAGAAIMAGAGLHGMPLSKASAAESNPTSPPTITTGQTVTTPNVQKPIVHTGANYREGVNHRDGNDRDKDKGDRGFEQRNRRDDRGVISRHGYDRFERQREMARLMERYNHRSDKIRIFNQLGSAVDAVRSAAPEMGFDVNNDSFTIFSQNGNQSIVTVVHNGMSYNIGVDRLNNGNWVITSVNPIQ